MNFSFFYKPGGSGYIRGFQMANYLGGKHNPTEGYENDICIYVKILPPENYPKHTYYDVDDSVKAVPWLKTHTDTGIIGISLTACEYLQNTLKRDDIIFIPHQHVNFERWVRPLDRPVTNVGIIGSVTAFQYPIDDLREKLRDVGLTLSYEPDYWVTYRSTAQREMRLNIVDFHKTMDIQVVWRPHGFSASQDPLRNPNKLGNASSFGIPTVAFPEVDYVDEWGGYFIEAWSIDQLISKCKRLKDDPAYYSFYANKALQRAEQYHIEKIARIYRKLP